MAISKITANALNTPLAGINVDGGTIKLDGNYPVGTRNVALGDGALDDGSLSGANNTAVGAEALTSNTSGAQNTAVGKFALQNVATGSNNTAVGNNALKDNTGNNNTAIGLQALAQNTTACNNTAVGYQALLVNTTGAQNTAIGRLAGTSNTTGTGNSFLGHAAGQYVTTGDNNTIVGRFDGNSNNLDLRTANNNVVLSDGDGCPRMVLDCAGTIYATRCDNTLARPMQALYFQSEVTVNDCLTHCVGNANNKYAMLIICTAGGLHHFPIWGQGGGGVGYGYVFLDLDNSCVANFPLYGGTVDVTTRGLVCMNVRICLQAGNGHVCVTQTNCACQAKYAMFTSAYGGSPQG